MAIFSRNELYWGKEAQTKLAQHHVTVFGLGGVGGFCAEMLARAGVGELTIVDFDNVSQSNINRQIVALKSTVGQEKTKLFEQRLKDINPDIKINVINDFYTEKLNKKLFDLKPDFIADAIDTMHSKVALLEFAYKDNCPVISSFGAGNRINPEDLYICDISKIEDKNAAFVSNILYQLKKREIEKGITVVASREKPFSMEKLKVEEKITTQSGKEIEFSKIIPSSTPFVASCAGIFMASYIVRELISK
ncbi:MAG: ThiF family adenylyltransferase [Candidatus Gastranaerophilales bacterium]|nr:ThiF family adenylyltransferase [Candidatus Gastranaerophilales bacterium]